MSYKIFIDEFPTMDSFWKFCETAPNNAAFGNRHESDSTGGGRFEFTGTKTLEEALNLFRNGYDAGAKAINCDGSGFSRQVQRAQVRNYYVGACPNVPRAMQGLPDAMRQVYRVPQKQRVITVFYDVCASGCVGAEEMQEAAKRFYAAVNALEKSGVRVEILVGEAVTYEGGRETVLVSPAITVKKASERGDSGRLGFVLTHPSFLRRLMFKYSEVCTHLGKEHEPDSRGYGHVVAYDASSSESFLRELSRMYKGAVYMGVTKILNDEELKTEQGILDYMRSEAAAGDAQ